MTEPDVQTPSGPNAKPPEGDGLESLPDSWQEYIRALRSENAGWRVNLRTEQTRTQELSDHIAILEAQVAQTTNKPTTDKTPGDQPLTVAATGPDTNQEPIASLRAELAQELAQLKSEVLQMKRAKIAAEFDIPDILADRLRGDTEDDLRADAKIIAASLRPADSSTETAADPPEAEPPTAPTAPDGTAAAQPPITVTEKPTTQAAPPPASTTTKVPGGQSVGRTDADRRREYFGGGPSSAFNGGGLTVTTKTVQKE